MALRTQRLQGHRPDKQQATDAIALPIFTYGPVDRVGVIRKLRLLPHHLWTAESPQQRQMLSFEGLYRWPEGQHARGEARTLYDPSTEQLLPCAKRLVTLRCKPK